MELKILLDCQYNDIVRFALSVRLIHVHFGYVGLIDAVFACGQIIKLISPQPARCRQVEL